MLPTFIVIGAAKCGTSSLAAYLRGHPQVFMTDPKEPHFFSRRRAGGLESYESLFAGSEGYLARGEASTSYTQAPRFHGVPGSIHAAVPDVRLIYLVRDPVERIRSQYLHYVDRGRERRTLERAVVEDPDYLDTSRYAHQLELFLEHFRRDQLLVLANDRLRTDREATVRQVFEFVGVDPDSPTRPLDHELNRSADKRRTPAAVDAARRLVRRSGVGRRVPKSLRVRVHRATSRPIPPAAAQVPDDLAEWIWSELSADLGRLRGIVGPDFDLWGRA
jgi:hypothetical protein